MWTCPKCLAQFYNKNQWHSCGRYSVAGFLKGKSKHGISLYRHFLREYRKIGPFTLHPVKSRIAFLVKTRFSGVNKISGDYIAGGFYLTRRYPSPKFYKIEVITPRALVHYFRLRRKSDIDREFRKYMRLAYNVGMRKHVEKR